MSQEGSEHLISAHWQYLQRDMAFKRLVGFYEFELAVVDRINNTSKWYCP